MWLQEYVNISNIQSNTTIKQLLLKISMESEDGTIEMSRKV